MILVHGGVFGRGMGRDKIGLEAVGTVIPQGAADDLHDFAVMQIDAWSEQHKKLPGQYCLLADELGIHRRQQASRISPALIVLGGQTGSQHLVQAHAVINGILHPGTNGIKHLQL